MPSRRTVYETSALRALQVADHAQLVSALSVLVPGLYTAADAHAHIGTEIKADRGSDEEGNTRARLASLSIRNDAPAPPSLGVSRASPTERRHRFAGLMLLYQICYLDAPGQYLAYRHAWTTNPSVRARARGARDKRRASGYASEADAGGDAGTATSRESHTGPSPVPPSTPPFIDARNAHIHRAARVYLATSRSLPLAYHRLQLELDANKDAPERILLAWGAARMQAAAWRTLRAAYMQVPLAWAGRVLLLRGPGEEGDETTGVDEWEDAGLARVAAWCVAHGARVQGDKVYLR